MSRTHRLPARLLLLLVALSTVALAACSGPDDGHADADADAVPVGPSAASHDDEDAPTESGISIRLRPEDLAAALTRTREVRTGRYVLGVEIASGVEGAPSLDTHVEGAFDRGADAVTAAMDVDESFAGAPEIAAGLPDELRGRRVEVRTVAGESWMRLGEDAPWTPASTRSPFEAVVPGVDQMLDLLDHADDHIEARLGGVYEGHVDVRALADASGPLAAFAHLADVLPPEAAGRLIVFRASIDRYGRVDSLEVELDLAAAAEAVGEAPPEGAALRWRLQLTELDEPVVIAPPVDVAPES